MTVRRSMGRPRPQPSRPEKLPTGVAAPAPEVVGPVERDRSGKIASKEAARELGRRGGRAKAERARESDEWQRRIGLQGLIPDLEVEPFIRPFIDEGERWYTAKRQEIASTVGGGVCSAGVCSILKTATWERTMSNFLFELSVSKLFAWVRGKDSEGKPKLDPRLDLTSRAQQLGDSSRQNLLAAHELCAREAIARKSAPASTSSALAERVEVLIAAEQANALRWKSQLEAKSTTVEAPSATDSRETVEGTQELNTATSANGPAREQSPVATSASTAASQTSPVHASPIHPPSPLAGVQAHARPVPPTQQEMDRRELGGLGYESAKRLVMGAWYGAEQNAENKWQASGRRGRRPLTPRFIHAPLSTWLRKDLPNEVEWAEKHFGWVFEKEKNA